MPIGDAQASTDLADVSVPLQTTSSCRHWDGEEQSSRITRSGRRGLGRDDAKGSLAGGEG
jgi:hypothetical protein